MKKIYPFVLVILILFIICPGCIKENKTITPPTYSLSLIAQEWETDSLYYNYTSGTPILEYARGGSSNILNYDNSRATFMSDGNINVYDNLGNFESWSWSLSPTDSTALTIVTTGGTVHTRILRLDATHLTYYDSTNNALNVLVKTSSSSVSVLSLLTEKEWKTDSLYYNYTTPGTGTLEYARGGSSNILNYDNSRAAFWIDGNADIFENNGTYEAWSWSLNAVDSTAFTLVTPGGTVHARILRLDATHLTYYDAVNHALDVLTSTPPSVPSLLLQKQWQTDTLYYNYTTPGTGTLEYARGASSNLLNFDNSRAIFWDGGGEDVFDNSGVYQAWSWSLGSSTALTIVTTGGPVHTTITQLDATHLTYYDATNHALDVLGYKP
jgi:hypothetical protein